MSLSLLLYCCIFISTVPEWAMQEPCRRALGSIKLPHSNNRQEIICRGSCRQNIAATKQEPRDSLPNPHFTCSYSQMTRWCSLSRGIAWLMIMSTEWRSELPTRSSWLHYIQSSGKSVSIRSGEPSRQCVGILSLQHFDSCGQLLYCLSCMQERRVGRFPANCVQSTLLL